MPFKRRKDVTAKRTKYRKMQKGRVKGIAQRGTLCLSGTFGIKALNQDGSQAVRSRQLVSQ